MEASLLIYNRTRWTIGNNGEEGGCHSTILLTVAPTPVALLLSR